jgi:hypothetical protein
MNRFLIISIISYLIGFYIAIDKAHSDLYEQVGIGMVVMFISGIVIYNSFSGKRFFSKRENIQFKDFVFSFSLLISFFLSYNLNEARNEYLLSQEVATTQPNNKDEVDECNDRGFCHKVCYIAYIVGQKKYDENISNDDCKTDFTINYSISRPDVFYISVN